ncbi:MAG: gyrase, subunit, partial [Caulobacter sp.]|nr:gyrase, subunit [Caulobacter sp.]
APVAEVRIAGRNTRGVIIFRTAADEHVVSVERLAESEASGDDEAADELPDDGAPDGGAPEVDGGPGE